MQIRSVKLIRALVTVSAGVLDFHREPLCSSRSDKLDRVGGYIPDKGIARSDRPTASLMRSN